MIFLIILFLSALFISGIAAWFSIAGLMAIFPGAAFSIALMGAALEVGKLVSASWLYRFWDKANILMKTYFTTAVVVLSFITSIGIFGYLTKSHIEGTQGLDTNSEQLSLIESQIIIEKENIEGQRKALLQLDAAVNNLVSNQNTTERAITIRNRQRSERTNINKQISESNKKVLELQQQKAQLNIGQRQLETEVGPIKYVAQMVYGVDDSTTIQKAVRLLTLLLIFVFDPLAILMVVAANMQIKQLVKQKKTPTPKRKPLSKIIPEVKQTAENTASMQTDWNPGSWFKIVKSPK